MARMFATLEVSKLSGLLNADACCRESKRGHTVRGEVRAGRQEAAGDRGARSVQGEGSTADRGPGHGEERTENMLSMVVTLEVSKLSGWLNADAPCQESNGGHTVWGEVQSTGRGGRRRTTAAQAACRGGLDCRLGAGHGEERT
eukprot:scaffold81772_cov49-Phaeocystis_antarctica.AAC.5